MFLLGPNGGAFLFFKAGFEVQALLQKRRNLELPLGLASKNFALKINMASWKITRLPDRSFPLSCLFSGVVNPEIASHKQAMLSNFESKSNPPKSVAILRPSKKICGKA